MIHLLTGWTLQVLPIRYVHDKLPTIARESYVSASNYFKRSNHPQNKGSGITSTNLKATLLALWWTLRRLLAVQKTTATLQSHLANIFIRVYYIPLAKVY